MVHFDWVCNLSYVSTVSSGDSIVWLSDVGMVYPDVLGA